MHLDVIDLRQFYYRTRQIDKAASAYKRAAEIAAANGGTLTFMVGGTDSAFSRAKPILEAMGKAVIHAGDAGNGRIELEASFVRVGEDE